MLQRAGDSTAFSCHWTDRTAETRLVSQRTMEVNLINCDSFSCVGKFDAMVPTGVHANARCPPS